jgi:hypothetical protein
MNNTELRHALSNVSSGEQRRNLVQPYETMKSLIDILHGSSYVSETSEGISSLTGSSKSQMESVIVEALDVLATQRNVENRNQNAINNIQ